MLKIVSTIRLNQTRRFLKRYGYLPQVRRVDLDKVGEDSTTLKEAVRRFQLMNPPDLIGTDDGIVGERTWSFLNRSRCQVPDFFDDPELFEDPQVEALYSISAGSGSWPTECHESGIKVYIDTTNAPSFIDVDKIFANSQRAYGQVGVKLVRHPTSAGAHIRQSWRVLAGSTIGLAQFNSRSCSSSVFNYRDPGYKGSERTQFNLDLHELGHNHNLNHTSGGIMNPSILDTRPDWVVFGSNGSIEYQDVSYPTLVRFFGGKPIPGPSPPSPPDPPSPSPDPCEEFCKSLFKSE